MGKEQKSKKQKSKGIAEQVEGYLYLFLQSKRFWWWLNLRVTERWNTHAFGKPNGSNVASETD
jgi:hypothetical protein